MDYNKIKSLLDKYFEGETSLAEEQQLQQYFRQPSVPESLQAYQPLFQFLVEEQERQLPADFETRLLATIATDAPGARIVPWRTWLARAAAVLLVAVGAWWLASNLPTTSSPPVAETIDWSKYEPESPEEAYQILKTSLTKVSVELKDGTEKAVEEVSKVKKINEVFN